MYELRGGTARECHILRKMRGDVSEAARQDARAETKCRRYADCAKAKCSSKSGSSWGIGSLFAGTAIGLFFSRLFGSSHSASHVSHTDASSYVHDTIVYGHDDHDYGDYHDRDYDDDSDATWDDSGHDDGFDDDYGEDYSSDYDYNDDVDNFDDYDSDYGDEYDD